MLACFTIDSTQTSVPIILITSTALPAWLVQQSPLTRAWIENLKFTAQPDSYCCVPNDKGQLQMVVVGCCNPSDIFAIANLPTLLPEGIYRLESWQPLAALGWGLGAYQFTRYKKPSKNYSQLLIPENEYTSVQIMVEAIYLVRDLINTPAEDMGPAELAQTTESLASQFGATLQQIIGDDLKESYPAIHAVGRASSRAPRLLDLRWGELHLPKVTLIGKGVCFDSGGLDLKPSSNMLLMKKDMGGAAHVLGLAYLIMSHQLPIHLRVLIPAVENAVSGNAFRPGDIIKTHKGLTVEIGNTDAEGRLILADALSEATTEMPELLIDIATLTGAARTALGPELPALFTNNDKLAETLLSIGNTITDPLWRLPLYQPYRKMLDSRIADINNSGNSPYAGAITAALFLKEFITDKITWAHLDIMAWNNSSQSGRPEGGEVMGLRTLFAYLQKWVAECY